MLTLVRFVVFFMLVAGLLVFVVLPTLASPMLTQYVRDLGVEADDLRVTVDAFDPALLSGRAARLRVEGTDVTIGPARVSRMDLTLGNVSLFDRSFETVSGRLAQVVVSAGGIQAAAAEVDVRGPATHANATGRFDAGQSEQMIRLAAARVGVALDDARLVDGGLRLIVSGVDVSAGIAVEGGALVLRPALGEPIVLLQPATSDLWRLDEAFVSPSGITVRGRVDATRLAAAMAKSPDR